MQWMVVTQTNPQNPGNNLSRIVHNNKFKYVCFVCMPNIDNKTMFDSEYSSAINTIQLFPIIINL